MNITVYLGANAGNDPALRDAVRALGRWIGESGNALVYGGSKNGLMGALAESVLAAGGRATGVEPQVFVDQGFLYDELTELIVTRDFPERKAKMLELGDAFIAFPGGTGTLEEIAEVMSRVALGQLDAPCILYNLNGYYDGLRTQLAHMIELGLSSEARQRGIYFADDLEQIRQLLEGFPTKGLQTAARRICVPAAHKFHTCSLSSIFSHAHVARENDFTFLPPAGGGAARVTRVGNGGIGMWFVFALLSAVFAALTSILAKVGIDGVNSNLATAIRTMVVLAMAWGMVFVTNTQGGLTDISKKSWLFLILSGLATGASWLCYYRALQIGEASKVVPIDKLSVVITLVLAFVFLHERFTPKSLIGCLLIGAGTLLMVL